MTERKKRDLSGMLEIDNWPMQWTLKSEQQWKPGGEHVGLCLSIQRTDEAHRELVLEYPFVDLGKTGRPEVNIERIEGDIRQAMAAGWKPKSRGRPFIFVLD
jgi:hypothetical protein